MKVIVTKDFYDLTAFTGRRAGDVIEVPEDRGAKLIEMRFAEAEGQKAKPAAKPAAKKTAKKN
jgi:hypothetical protein